MRQKCFGLVMAIPALPFLACLHIEFARVYLPVFRTHLQLCRHLLRSVFLISNSQWCPASSSERKTRKCSFEEENRTAARGRCLGLKPPLSQTTMKARIGHPWRPNSMVLAFMFNPGKIGAIAVPASFAVASRNKKPTKHQGHQSPQHGFSGTRTAFEARATVCLTPNRRAQRTDEAPRNTALALPISTAFEDCRIKEPKLLVRPRPSRTHPCSTRSGQSVAVMEEAKVFLSSCGSPRWTATSDLCVNSGTPSFLKYRNSQGREE